MAARSEPAPPIARIADGELPDIAIGILSHNRVDEVERSLDVFLASDYPTNRLHLIVVDNASTDGTRERVLERYGGRVEVVRLDENMGALARNVVLLGRPERYLFQFDEDCAPADPDTLRRAVEILEAHPAIGGICLRSINQYTGRSDWADFSRVARRRRGGWGYEGVFVIGNGMAFRREAIQRTGGYDARIFWGSEELQLALELYHHDISILYVPSLALVHRHAPRAQTRTQVLEVEARNNVLVAFIYLPLPLAIAFAAIQIGRRALANFVHRREYGVGATLRGARRALAMLGVVFADRRPIPISRIALNGRWFFATLFGLRPAPGEPADAGRVARSPRAADAAAMAALIPLDAVPVDAVPVVAPPGAPSAVDLTSPSVGTP
jgi:GT2 family glycosyltransferase